MKQIIEVYPDKRFLYTMPDNVYELVMNVWDQSQRIRAKTSLTYIYDHLPIELQVRIKREEIAKGEEKGSSLQKIYIDEMITDNE